MPKPINNDQNGALSGLLGLRLMEEMTKKKQVDRAEGEENVSVN
jgi:hypothetical protein